MDSDLLAGSAIRFDNKPAAKPAGPALASDRRGAPRVDPGPGLSALPLLLLADCGARILIDANRRIVWATRAASLLASGESCIRIANGELAGSTRHSDALLGEMLADSRLAAPAAVVALLSSEPANRPELFVKAKDCPRAGPPCTLLIIRDLARELREIPDMGRLYGFTRTEQQIVAMMIEGQSVTEIAERLHKSVLTVRTHAKRIYGKLGVRSKEQLFSTVMKLMID